MKKSVALLALLLVVGMFVACTGEAVAAPSGEVSILIPGATHGWPLGVLYYSNEKQAELEAAGQAARVYTAMSAEEQSRQIDNLLARSDIRGIMILPFDNSVTTAAQRIVARGIPFVMFDRLLEDVKAAANVQGDNHGIGYETARIFLDHGIKKTDKILEMPGDNSSVPEMRSNGFYTGLKELGGWTDADIAAALFKTDFTGWSRDNAKPLFESFVGSRTQEELDKYRFIFTHDDEIAIGIFNAIKGGNLGKNIDAVEVLAASAGCQEMYKILNSKEYEKDFYLFSLTYPPYMVRDAIDVLMKVLAGEKVEKDIIIPVQKVDSSNAASFLNPASPY